MNTSDHYLVVGMTSSENTSSNSTCRFGYRNSLEFSWKCFAHEFELSWGFRLKAIYFTLAVLLTIALNMFIIYTNLRQYLETANGKNGKKATIRCSVSILYFKTNMSFTSNAIADLICGSVIMTFTHISILFEHWPFTVNACLVWSILDFSTGTCSIFHMLIIAHDRLLSLKNPFKLSNLHMSMNGATIMNAELRKHFVKLLGAWFCAFLFWVPLLVPVLLKQNPVDYYTCDISLSGHVTLPHSFIVYFLPISLILLFYFLSFYYLHKNLKNLVTKKSQELPIQIPKNLKRNKTESDLKSSAIDKKLTFEFDSIGTMSKSATFEQQIDDQENDQSQIYHFKEVIQKVFIRPKPEVKSQSRSNSKTLQLHKNEIKVFKRLLFITTTFLICWLPW
jgi:hypothetical protein